MLTCRDVELMLQDHLDGVLLPSQQEVLERHLRACAPCRGTLAGIARLEERFEGHEDDVDAPASLSSAILSALPAEAYRPSPAARLARYGAVPALLALLLAVGFLMRGHYWLKSRSAERELEVSFQAPAATSVAIVGDFNGWDIRRNLLVRSSHEGRWGARLRLPPGVYQYSFVVDGTTWEVDPAARQYVNDGFGGRNSVIIVDG
ncbi:MAG TPA: zf-HC2 domain-containing protein [bacterium]